jgi:integrase
MEFKEIMRKAGVNSGTVYADATGKGRKVADRSFHSLRHSFNSALANAGVSQEVRQKLTGHASAEMNAIYTHHELDVLRDAVNALPKVQVNG